ncbi:MAG: glycoside hydrolase family 3 N-terminal domain-containing protein [Jatrophihabitantaceae bacterium]
MSQRSGRSSGRLLVKPRAFVVLCLMVAACTSGNQARPTTGQSAGAGSTAATTATSQAGTSAAGPPVTATPTKPAANPAGLTDAELVGQLFVSYVYGASASSASPAHRQANLALYGVPTGAEVVRRWHLGGIILIDHNTLDPARSSLSTGNVGNAGQISNLTTGLQAAAVADSGVRLLIGTDQEGGSVQRITNGVSWRPAQLRIGQQDAGTLRCDYLNLGRQLRALGVNQDYAPVADVVRATGGVIGDRSFGPDPATDSRDVRAAVTGLQDAGVLATLKHWPGHGSTPVDSHESLPVLTESAAQWRAIDRPPFQAATDLAGSIMVGHLALPALDPSGQPATLSPALVTGQLRQGLGYRGLVLTDSLWMAPMWQAGTPAQVAVRAIRAGVDMLLMSPDVPGASGAVLTRLRSDRTFRVEVQAAVQRILAAKARLLTVASVTGC